MLQSIYSHLGPLPSHYSTVFRLITGLLRPRDLFCSLSFAVGFISFAAMIFTDPSSPESPHASKMWFSHLFQLEHKLFSWKLSRVPSRCLFSMAEPQKGKRDSIPWDLEEERLSSRPLGVDAEQRVGEKIQVEGEDNSMGVEGETQSERCQDRQRGSRCERKDAGQSTDEGLGKWLLSPSQNPLSLTTLAVFVVCLSYFIHCSHSQSLSFETPNMYSPGKRKCRPISEPLSMDMSSGGLGTHQNDLQDCWKPPVNVLVSTVVRSKGLLEQWEQNATQEVMLLKVQGTEP